MNLDKIGRNSLCWCGSGMKYKKCHLDRDKQKPLEPWEISKEMKSIFSTPVCSVPKNSYPSCTKKIVKAHTIPKSNSLKSIARSGHVYGLDMSFENVHKNKGKIRPGLIGINRASTFSGFCNYHDDLIFAPIEKQNFTCSPEQCFLLAYRAVSRELYTKNAMINLSGLRSQIDKGKDIIAQLEINEMNMLTENGALLGLRDIKYHKEQFDNCLDTGDFSKIQAVIFEFDVPPPVMVSGATEIDFDFNGVCIQDLGDMDKIMDILSMTSFYDGKKGWIIFSWLENSYATCNNLINSLFEKPRNDINFLLLQYIFRCFENYFIQPSWWDALSAKNKNIISAMTFETVRIDHDPHGDAIAKIHLDLIFPTIKEIHFVNYTLDKNDNA